MPAAIHPARRPLQAFRACLHRGPSWRRLGAALLVAAGWLGAGLPAAAEDIRTVLERSHALKLRALAEVERQDDGAELLQRDFRRLLARVPEHPEVRLMVVGGPVIAETLAGRVVVVHVGLAQAGEGERLFLLAHELGHALMHHWDELGALYQHYIPGEVKPETTDPVAAVLGRSASQLVHGHEYAADAFAWRTIRAMGFGLESADAVFRQMPNVGDTATHPASRKRMAALRAIGDEPVRSAAVVPVSER
jgi:Zn-dependent protease with chaperone function